MAPHPAKKLNLKNIGPKTEWMLFEIGIDGYDALNRVGSVEAFSRLQERFNGKFSLNALYAMEAALWGIHWLELLPEVKEQLKEKYKKSST